MNNEADIFKIESNNVLPSQGKILISEPFLCDVTFRRSVVLLVDHTNEGTMGLIINKELPLSLNHLINEFKYIDTIPLFKGGPICTDTLFYLHTLPDIPEAFQVNQELYINGNFDAIKRYILQGNPVEGKIRFFLGYSGWQYEQLEREITENSWMISKEEASYLLTEESKDMWRKS
ncbi:MAG: YqgE/AlgH family protein, partial [Bacteroides sp.]